MERWLVQISVTVATIQMNYSLSLPAGLADAPAASVQNFEIRSEKGFLKSGNQFRVSRS